MVVSIAVTAMACSIGALDGFSGGAGANDAGAPETGPGAEAGSGAEAAPSLVKGPSCKQIKAANPTAGDGRYLIEPPGAQPFEADCDMTRDGGGWMRVTAAMIAETKDLETTSVRDADETGALLVRVYANSRGCGDDPDNVHVTFIRDLPTWSQLRARYDFYGSTDCWEILGSLSKGPVNANLIPFEPTVDVARDMLRMGGSAGDAFDGVTDRCDVDPKNFWAQPVSVGRRSLVAVLRRASPDVPAGLGTFASCTTVAAATASPTYWEYREIYVR
jgi:hypothetical protein